ncbi:hypothetical protein PG993_000533 [Apiospora rasikravindrae]|uniref:Uncharacterized protein n=1 Tax=Apiospora rasikravindrae TaxID=990691 RepID=A0ABR1U8U5_9PEZI
MNVEQCRKASAEVLAGSSTSRSIGPTLASRAHEREKALLQSEPRDNSSKQAGEAHAHHTCSSASHGNPTPLRTRAPAARTLLTYHDRNLQRPSYRNHCCAAALRANRNRQCRVVRPPRERRPLGLAQAWNLAKATDDDNNQGDETFDLKNAFDMAKAEADGVRLGSPSPAPRPQRVSKDSQELGSVRNAGRDLGQQLKRFDRNHQLANNSGPLRGLFTRRNSIGPKVTETANALAAKSSEGGLQDAEGPYGASQEAHSRKQSSESLLSEEDYHRFSPLPSIEPSRVDMDRSPNKNRPHYSPRRSYNSPSKNRPNFSPEKSYNWQLDADFTAGDLQISDSPRIKAAKTDDRETNRASPSASSQASDSPSGRRSDARLEQIRQREIEAAGIEFPESDESFPRKTNRRLDEIRAREMEARSRRAVATSRLDEIRIKNSEARSESQSPELVKNIYQDHPHRASFSGLDTAKTNGVGGEAIRDGPFTASRNLNERHPNKASSFGGIGKTETSEGLSRNDSYDLLRQLARATSASPSPPPPANTKNTEELLWQEPVIKQEPAAEKETTRPRFLRDERRPRNFEAKGFRERLSVGFAGLRKSLSSDSQPEKRRLKTTTIYSEKGSVRAPSPAMSDTTDDEETPRQDRAIDPLSQPTPRVTGAYVDTPATVKVKNEDGIVPEKAPEARGSLASRLLFGSRSRTSSKSESESKEPEIKQEESDGSGRTGRTDSKPASQRGGSRSTSRRRRPLINTAKIPTPSEDLRAILRHNQIDDSTLDDAEFDRLLAGSNLDHDALEKVVSETIQAVDEASGAANSAEREEELERQRIDRMSKSLKTGLLSIRSAKQGIERLEGKVAQSEHQIPPDLAADLGKPGSWKFPSVQPQHGDSGIRLPIPRLYRRKPRFAFTPFGLLSFVLLTWYTLESAFCYLYVSDYECLPSYPCDWSPHEPYFPYAMPFMLDEWTTGGKGRELAWRVGEEVGDLAAEVTDWISGDDFTMRDTMYMDAWERKRHWRRLRKKGLVKKWVEPPRVPREDTELEGSLPGARTCAGDRGRLGLRDDVQRGRETVMSVRPYWCKDMVRCSEAPASSSFSVGGWISSDLGVAQDTKQLQLLTERIVRSARRWRHSS